MRRLLAFVVALAACANVRAQAISCDGGQAKVQQVVEMPGKSAEDIYKLAQRWVALSFHNKDKVVQTEIENELIRGDGYEPGRMKVAPGAHSDLKYSFSIEVKENKLRFTMYDMAVADHGVASFPAETYLCKSDGSFRNIPIQTKNVKASVEGLSAQLIASLHSALAEKKEDW
jgi:hypothetical protein